MDVRQSTTSQKIYAESGGVRLVKSGVDYFELLRKLIPEARETIHLQTYIFSDDATGNGIADALIMAAKRQVTVYILVDGYASKHLPKPFIKALTTAGARFRFFEPLFNSSDFYFGRRLHHKVFVCDGEAALVGGINIADRYNDVSGKPAWLDFAVYVQGAPARQLAELCESMWKGTPVKSAIVSLQSLAPNLPDQNQPLIRIKRNDWVRHKNEISGSYISMLRHSKTAVTIMCSYFLPGKVIRRLIRQAVQRGVRVVVITAGQSDIRISKNAERWLYDWLLRNKVTLYEYQPSVLHAKVAIADDHWMTIGSYNINDISTYVSIELNLDIVDAGFTAKVRDLVEHIMDNDCKKITKEEAAFPKNIFTRFIQWASYRVIRVLIYLFTFYFKQHRETDKTHFKL